MAITVTGNIGKTFFKPNALVAGPGNRIIVAASAASDIALVPASMLFKSGVINNGVTFQLAQSTGTLAIALTISPKEQVLRVQTDAAWHVLSAALANNAMVQTALTFSYIRLTFSAVGICYIVAL